MKNCVLSLTSEELDAVCLALSEAKTYREQTGTKTDVNVAKVYEALRRKIRDEYPLTTGMQRLVEGL